VDEVTTLLDEFERLLHEVADGRLPVGHVDAWYRQRSEALRACESADLKKVVQHALVRTWSWRHGSIGDAEARTSLRALAGRLPTA
jgi:hypothetical protein